MIRHHLDRMRLIRSSEAVLTVDAEYVDSVRLKIDQRHVINESHSWES